MASSLGTCASCSLRALPGPVGWELASLTLVGVSPTNSGQLLWAKPGWRHKDVKKGEAGPVLRRLYPGSGPPGD